MNIVNEYGIIGIYYICVNIIAFILYGLDKNMPGRADGESQRRHCWALR